ncbi:hypothetical protein ACJIZ3_005554 [Penstemon smallii]|uniref:Uncharacterized protein n=1 Tax=Penstemon smallii TaxID=265156 RepID=A0ABD3S575_9LAMI
MASSSSAAVFLLVAILFSAAALPTHASLISVYGVQVRGLLVCSATGNLTPSCLNCRGIAGVNVTITCNGARTSIYNLVTDSNGFFNGLLTIADGLLFDTSAVPCTVSVRLPIASCTLLAGSGTLRAPVTFIGTIIGTVVGLVAQVTAGAFTLVPLVAA